MLTRSLFKRADRRRAAATDDQLDDQLELCDLCGTLSGTYVS